MDKSLLAVNGGPRAAAPLSPQPSKLGREELMELIGLWEMSPDVRRKIEALLAGDTALRGPHLFRYYNPRPSKVAEAEQLFARYIGVPHALAVNSCTSALLATGCDRPDEPTTSRYEPYCWPAER